MPVVGEDDRYPKNHKRRSTRADKTKFTIRAEKCPNRRGVELILKHFQGELIGFDKALERIERGDFSGAYVVGGYVYPNTGYCERSTKALSKLSDVDRAGLAANTANRCSLDFAGRQQLCRA